MQAAAHEPTVEPDHLLSTSAGEPSRKRSSSKSAEDLVDAALAGLDQREVITIPALPDRAEWDAFETARRAMSGGHLDQHDAPTIMIAEQGAAMIKGAAR